MDDTMFKHTVHTSLKITFTTVPDKVSVTNSLVPDIGHLEPDVKWSRDV